MGVVSWHQNISVGIQSLDDQHKELIRIINTLYEIITKEDNRRELQLVLGDLQQYTRTHFATEEKYFDRFAYPAAREHIQHHRVFTAKLAEFHQGFDSGTFTLTFQMMDFLQEWLVHHIMDMDKKYTDFFLSHGLG